eukprot:5309064-Pleurochrysis_carterae.AAC.1
MAPLDAGHVDARRKRRRRELPLPPPLLSLLLLFHCAHAWGPHVATHVSSIRRPPLASHSSVVLNVNDGAQTCEAAAEPDAASTQCVTVMKRGHERIGDGRRFGMVKPTDKLVSEQIDLEAFEVEYEHAVLLLKTGRYDGALALFGKLSKLNPGDGRVWQRMMAIYKRLRRFQSAERVIRAGLKACPGNAMLQQALADLLRERKRYTEARTHLRRALQLDPQLLSAYDSWGRMEAALGRHKLAESLFQRGLAIKPTTRLYHALGVLQAREQSISPACLFPRAQMTKLRISRSSRLESVGCSSCPAGASDQV